MQRGLTRLFGQRASQRFAIDGDQLSTGRFVQGLGPTKQAGRKLVPLQQAKHPAKGVVRGDAARQLQKSLQPFLSRFAELLDVRPILGAAHHRQQGHPDHVQKLMVAATHDARVRQVRKTMLQTLNKPAPGIVHDSTPDRGSRLPPFLDDNLCGSTCRKIHSDNSLRLDFDAPALDPCFRIIDEGH